MGLTDRFVHNLVISFCIPQGFNLFISKMHPKSSCD